MYDYTIRHHYDNDDNDYMAAARLDIKFMFPILFVINLVMGINSDNNCLSLTVTLTC